MAEIVKRADHRVRRVKICDLYVGVRGDKCALCEILSVCCVIMSKDDTTHRVLFSHLYLETQTNTCMYVCIFIQIQMHIKKHLHFHQYISLIHDFNIGPRPSAVNLGIVTGRWTPAGGAFCIKSTISSGFGGLSLKGSRLHEK